jgi:excisionase family DNA binding protein
VKTFAGVEGIYYIRVGDFIKVGYSADIERRMRDYPPGTVLLAVEPGDRLTERKRHAQFRDSLAWGNEWFLSSDALWDHYTTARKLHGSADHLMPRWRKGQALIDLEAERAQRQVVPTEAKETWVTLQYAADYIRVNVVTIRRMITRGEIEAKRFGPRLIRVAKSSLDAIGAPLTYVDPWAPA